MNKRKKFALIAAVVVVLLAIVGFSVQHSRKGVIEVQTGKVTRQDLTSVVTASGEIKPKVYVNVGANAMGKITHLYVKEGDVVKKGQLLATLDSIQSVADLNQRQAEYERAKLDYERNKALYDEKLIARADFDTKKAAFATSTAQV